MYSKTIHPRLCEATPACAGYGGLCIQRPYTLGYARRRSPARAMANYVFKDHTPSAMRGDARLRGLWRIMYSKTIHPRLCEATPACAGYGGLFVRRPSARRRRSPIGYRLSAIPQPHGKLSYRLLAIGYQLSAMECEARLRITRTPTVTLSAIGYRLSAIGYRLSAIGYRLSAIGYRLSAIGYRAMPIR
jgi:hypothetical protein